MFVVYFFYSFGIAHLVVALTTLLHSGHDPFFIALSFIVMFGGACSLGAGYMFYKAKLRDEYPSHAVDENIPDDTHPDDFIWNQWKRIQDEPAYLRRRREPEQLEFNFDD